MIANFDNRIGGANVTHECLTLFFRMANVDKVVVVGLANAPQYNYQRGAIKGWNPQSQRYSVFVAPNGAKEPRLVAIRPSNLVAESEIDEDDGDGEDDDL